MNKSRSLCFPCLLATALTVAIVGSTALAQDSSAPDLQRVLRTLDTDGDRELSTDEVQQATERLAALDMDGDDATVAVNPNFVRMNAWVEEMQGDILPGEDERAFEGYTLIHDSAFGYHNANRIYLIDNNGAVVHEWEPGPWQYDAAVAYLLPNGLLLRTVSKHDWLHMRAYVVGANGTVQLVDWDSNVVWEYEMDVPGKHVPHHDVEYMPNGNTIFVNAHNKHIIEVTPEGERVLDYRVPGPGRMYRIYKFGPDYPAFAGRSL